MTQSIDDCTGKKVRGRHSKRRKEASKIQKKGSSLSFGGFDRAEGAGLERREKERMATSTVIKACGNRGVRRDPGRREKGGLT